MPSKVTFTSWNPEKVLDQVAEAVEQKVKEAAEEVVTEAQRVVPVKTGALQRSIRILHMKREATRISVEIGSDLDYSRFIEWGSERKAQQPYLRPALAKVGAHLARIFRSK